MEGFDEYLICISLFVEQELIKPILIFIFQYQIITASSQCLFETLREFLLTETLLYITIFAGNYHHILLFFFSTNKDDKYIIPASIK